MGNSISAVVCNRGLDLIGDRPLLQVCNLKKVLDCRVLQTHNRTHTQTHTFYKTETCRTLIGRRYVIYLTIPLPFPEESVTSVISGATSYLSNE